MQPDRIGKQRQTFGQMAAAVLLATWFVVAAGSSITPEQVHLSFGGALTILIFYTKHELRQTKINITYG